MRDVTELPHVDLREVDSTTRLVTGLAMHGAAIFHNAAGRDELLRLARQLATIRGHRDSGDDGVTTIARRSTPDLGVSFAGFTDQKLWPHTDGSAVARPPRVVMLSCIRPARTGGGALLVDGRSLHDQIARTDPALLKALSAPQAASFGGPFGYRGPVFERNAEGRITVRLRLDELGCISPKHLETLRTLVAKRARVLELRAGDGYILLNDRWLHGRAPFTGDRLMLRVLGDLLPRLDLPPGFLPRRAGCAARPHHPIPTRVHLPMLGTREGTP